MAILSEEDELAEFALGRDGCYVGYTAAELNEIIKILGPVEGFDRDRLEFCAWWCQSLRIEGRSRKPSELSRVWRARANEVAGLIKSFKAMTGRELEDLEAAARKSLGDVDIFRTLRVLPQLQETLEEAAHRANGEVNSGRRPQAWKNEFYLALVEIYCVARAVRSVPRPSHDEAKGSWRNDRILRFIESCARPLRIRDSRHAIMRRLERIYF